MVSPSSAGAWVAPLPVTDGILATSCIDLALRRFWIAACGLDQTRRHALLVVEQGLEQMRGRDALMMLANGDGLRRLKEAAGAIGELFQIHPSTPLSWRRYGVARRQHKGFQRCGTEGCGGCGRRWAARLEASRGAVARKGLSDVGDIFGVDDRRANRGDRRVHVPAAKFGAVDVEAQIGVETEARRYTARHAANG